MRCILLGILPQRNHHDQTKLKATERTLVPRPTARRRSGNPARTSADRDACQVEVRIAPDLEESDHPFFCSKMNAEQVQQWDATMAEFEALLDPTAAWRLRHEQFVSFLRRHGRAPRGNSMEPAERKLAEWVGVQRRARQRVASVNVPEFPAGFDASGPNGTYFAGLH
jgi:hypothetical protein